MTEIEQTIFTKIINRDIPAHIWFETDYSLAFLDINPISPGHSLLISKSPYRWIQDVPGDELGIVMSDLPLLIKSLKQTTKCDYVQVAVMGLDVPHFHIHLVPRKIGDNHNELYPDETKKDQQNADLARQLLTKK